MSSISDSHKGSVTGIVFAARTPLPNKTSLAVDKVLAYAAYDLLLDSVSFIDCLVDKELLRDASIVKITSTNAFLVSHQSVLYHSLKAAAIASTRALAYKLAPFNIRCNALVLGLVNQVPTQDHDKALIENHAIPLASGPPSLRDINNAIDFLISDSSCAITGTSITVDAGMTIPDAYTVATSVFRTLKPE